ncbi:hypothetical protein BO85DRAFT_461008 [Aspergillus piperis CBS 112811]|uniref:F-box domain-containing protein n=1 Tax=Aspergillus piperis CBS 112811 TaxID=1448313 RepID=A0A8G1QY97_9EURO|nr:hypothetical protein BO85DRAFT_461008 [Aspergillus piperis CBS 112811]RAH55914.1 hypothetical protein BO85DRAFT_461008 [Aspergillus piperis CBS 112811]
MSLPNLPVELLFYITTLLLPLVQDVNSLAKTSKILMSLSWAAGNSHTEVSVILLYAEKINSNIPDIYLETLLTWTAGYDQSSLSTICNLSRPTTITEAVHLKADNYLIIMKLLLLTKNIQPDCWTKKILNKYLGVIQRLLVIKDMDLNFGSRTLLSAVTARYTDIIETLLAYKKINLSLFNKYNTTILASRKDKNSIILLIFTAERGYTDFDLIKTNQSSNFTLSELTEDIVRVFNEYKSRY